MDTKISPDFWNRTIDLTSEEKLSILWFRTNDRMRLCGYCEVSAKLFSVFTGHKITVLERALGGLSEDFLKVGKGWWGRRHIAEQFGRGKKLENNTMSTAIVRDLLTCSEELRAVVLGEYPELLEEFLSEGGTSPAKGLASPYQGQREGEREGEGEGAREGEVRGVGEGAAETLALETVSGRSEPTPEEGRRDALREERGAAKGAARPAEFLPEQAARMVALGEIKRRRPASQWSAEELRALRNSGLLTAPAEQFAEEVKLVTEFYRSEIPDKQQIQLFKRSIFSAILNNWPSELDRAAEWQRTVAQKAGSVDAGWGAEVAS